MTATITPEIQSLLRPHYITLKGYVSAGMEADKAPDKIFLNANENPYELPGLEGFARYPEPQPKVLRAAYGALYGVEESRIVMTRGADEAIAVLTKLFCEPRQDKILISSPTFGMYKVNSLAMPGAGVVDVPLIEEGGTFKLDIQGMIAQLGAVKMVFVCSPNNPTGNAFARADIQSIIDAARGKAMVILDETYIEFAHEGNPDIASFIGQLTNHPHVIILRTLSKSYALAGMRMGSMLCGDSALADLIRSKGLDAYPLPVASVQAAQAVATPQMQKFAKENRQKILDERARMEKELSASDEVLHVYPSDANFLLVKLKRPQAFLAACTAQGLIIRDFSGYEGTPDCIRLSIGTPAQNDRVLAVLRDF